MRLRVKIQTNRCTMRFIQGVFVVLVLVSTALSQFSSQDSRYRDDFPALPPPGSDHPRPNIRNKPRQQNPNQRKNSDEFAFPGPSGGHPNPSGSETDSGDALQVNKQGLSLSDAITKFSLEMTKSLLAEEDGNLVVSPVSLATVLALLQQGSSDNTITASELRLALGMGRGKSKNNFGTFLNTLKGGPASREMIFENAVFVQGSELNSEFKKVAKNAFQASIVPTQFNNPTLASSTINEWVNGVTKGKIPSLVEPGSLGPSTKCVLTNAVYFKNVWKTVFERSRTLKKRFNIHVGDGISSEPHYVMADFMQQSGNMVTGSNKTLRARWVKVPFDDKVYSMMFVLPLVQDGLDDMINHLKPEDLKQIIETTNEQTTHLSIPKFKISYSKSLVRVLKRMGVSNIFNSQNQDLSKIIDRRSIYVSDALQKAVISIDEQGATAAAATALTINTLSLASYYDEVRFIADQPFLVMILKDTIPIFMAKIKDPSLLA